MKHLSNQIVASFEKFFKDHNPNKVKIEADAIVAWNKVTLVDTEIIWAKRTNLANPRIGMPQFNESIFLLGPTPKRTSPRATAQTKEYSAPDIIQTPPGILFV
jgi:hypothetical protein